MNGHITVCIGDEILHYTLSSGITRIGSAPDCDLISSARGVEPEHCRLEWEMRSATWMLRPSTRTAGERMRINGVAVTAPAYLQDGDILQLPDMYIRFQRVPDPPGMLGKAVSELSLRQHKKLIFGRDTGQATEPGRVNLDATDTTISRVHAVVERTASGDYQITDESHMGTMLNGQHFRVHKLIVGDRFAIGGYNFEFTGHSIRRVARTSGAKVEARHISVKLKTGRVIMNDASLDVERCSFVGILGGSGQGKSTLLNALCGISPATSGSVYLNGARLGDPREMAAAGIGFVPQDDIVHVEITVEQALHFSARLRLPPETPARAIAGLVDETIERLGLTEHRKKRISQLSGGQRKRVSIATELLSKPTVLFLDEPSSGLDPATEYKLMALLRKLANKDCTVICTTHVLGNAHLFDKVAFVHDANVIFYGEPGDALQHFDKKALDEVYLELFDANKTGVQWRQEFEQKKGEVHLPDFGDQAVEVMGRQQTKRARHGGGYVRSLLVLLRRQWAILCADPLNLVFLLAQPLLIAGLVGWVADDAVLRAFLCIVATLWFGCSNGAQQIVKEVPVFRRERVCGLGINCYLQSKYLFLGSVTAFQALLMYLVTLAVSGLLNPLEVDKEVFRDKMVERLYAAPAKAGGPGAAPVDEGFEVVTADAPGPVGAGGPVADLPDVDMEAQKLEEDRKRNSWKVNAVVYGGLFFEMAHNLMDATEPPFPGQRSTGLVRPMSVWQVFAWVIGLKLLALLGAAAVGVAIGLAISALVQNSTQAVLWVPLILIPQILFGGFVVTRPEMATSVRASSVVVPSNAAQRIMDVAGIFGQTTPRMTNRTKYPVFLTPDLTQETVEWLQLGEKQQQKYDKVSDFNKSWQNLVVFPEQAGQHKNFSERRGSDGVVVYPQSVEERNDVRYKMGVIYQNLIPSQNAGLVLAAWVALCYLATWFGLVGKQTGKK